MPEVLAERRRQIIAKYSGLGDVEIKQIIRNKNKNLISQLVNNIYHSILRGSISKEDLQDALALISSYSPIMKLDEKEYASPETLGENEN